MSSLSILHRACLRLALLPVPPLRAPLRPPPRHLRLPRLSAMCSAASRLPHIVAAAAAGAARESNEPAAVASGLAQEDDDLSSGTMGYCLPPKEIQDIVDAPPLAVLSFSPSKDKILFLKRRALPPLSDLAKPEEKLAGVLLHWNRYPQADGRWDFGSRERGPWIPRRSKD